MNHLGVCYCPQCFCQLEGHLVIDEHVWLVRSCPDHGHIRTMLFESPEYYAKAVTAVRPVHTHRCLIVEVTSRCDVGCATCSASSTAWGSEPTRDQVIENALSAAHKIKANTIALSGGEPLVRGDLWEIADAIHDTVSKVVLITSGRNFETDSRILSAIAERSDWLEVYLQFDSLRDEVLQALRTPYMTAEVRRQRLRLAVATGAQVTAVCVVLPTSTDTEIGKLASFCRSEGCTGVTFQPLRMLGRYPVPTHVSSPLSTVDYIQRTALGALDQSELPPVPFSQQPFDISVAVAGSGKLEYPENFFWDGHREGSFRIATSSYWDYTNFFGPLAGAGEYYFHIGDGTPLNAHYFQPLRPNRGQYQVRRSRAASRFTA